MKVYDPAQREKQSFVNKSPRRDDEIIIKRRGVSDIDDTGEKSMNNKSFRERESLSVVSSEFSDIRINSSSHPDKSFKRSPSIESL